VTTRIVSDRVGTASTLSPVSTSTSGEIGAAVIGAGPYGLAAATHLSSRGVEHRTFGNTMGGWVDHMPKGMFLKSTAGDSSVGSPNEKTGIGTWCETAGIEPYDKDGGETPIPIADFIEYGRWFQEREVPELEEDKVVSVVRSNSGFEVELASGERFPSATVVVAVGTAPFAYVPPELRAQGAGADWTSERVSHSADHTDLSKFSGKSVAVIGRGQSALETAVLLHEAGAAVHLLVRSPEVLWGGPPRPPNPTRLQKLRTPPSQLGDGWTHLFITRYTAAYRRLPDRLRLVGVQRILGPFGAWWLRDRFNGIDLRLLTKVVGAGPQADGVRLNLDHQGTRSYLDVDHVIAATGYRVDPRSLDLLSDELVGSIATLEGSPRLTADFESSVPGLFFSGLAAAATFGPMLRFVCGSGFAGPRVAEGVVARLGAH
jgi:FAD-dependent urate hydroxylase